MSSYTYKIQNLDTGLFSLGGFPPKFGKVGKVWSGPGPFHNHLSGIDPKCYKNCVVIRYKMVQDVSFKFEDYTK